MADEEKRPWPRWWVIGAVVAVAGLLAVLLLVGGGDHARPAVPVNPRAGERIVDRELCRKQLEGALEALGPSRLGISSSAGDVAANLNNWWAECGDSAGIVVDTESLRPLLSAEVFERVIDDRFDARDADHIHDCLLFRRIAERIAAVRDTQLERAQAAFDFAVRQVAVSPAGADEVPLPCMYAAMFGRAEAAHRAWLLAEILRQLSIDCVIIEPAGDGPAAENEAWLAGVIVPGEGVYLFDPAAGIAIPGGAGPEAEETGGILWPATLKEARARDDLLRRLDVPGGPAYPWTAEQLQQVSVRVIGESSFWSPRMARLQNRLPGEFAMTVFDGLSGNPFVSAGLLDRVRQAGADGAWQENDVSLWEFPGGQLTAFYAAGGEDAEALAERMQVLKAPRLLMQQPDGAVVDANSTHPLRMVRLQQLSGNLEDALKGLGSVRFASIANPVVVNELAKEDAVYWIGLCQYELHREDAALGNLEIYQRDYPFGVWIGPVRALRAHCLARLGRFDEAAQAMLEKGAAGSPLSFGEEFLVRQWQALVSETAEGEPDGGR